MPVISFSKKPEDIWLAAGWAFRQVLADVLSNYPNDAEMMAEFEDADAYSALMIHRLAPEFGWRIADRIRHVAKGILSGKIRSGIVDQPYGDPETVTEYLKGLSRLLEIINQASIIPAISDTGRFPHSGPASAQYDKSKA